MSRRLQFIERFRDLISHGNRLVNQGLILGADRGASRAEIAIMEAQIKFLEELVDEAEKLSDDEWDAKYPAPPWWQRWWWRLRGENRLVIQTLRR